MADVDNILFMYKMKLINLFGINFRLGSVDTGHKLKRTLKIKN